jgi:RHS repeat-associated protein
LVADNAFSPYGEVYNVLNSTNQNERMFTGLSQDILSGMWDTPNRELSSVGRWLSPDPAGAGWNQYAYTTNPNSFVDPSGLTDCPQDKTCGIYGEGGDGGGGGDGGDGGDGSIPLSGDDGNSGGYFGPGNPGNGCAAADASCGQQGNFWNGGSATPSGPLWDTSQLQWGEQYYDNQVDCGFSPGSCKDGVSVPPEPVLGKLTWVAQAGVMFLGVDYTQAGVFIGYDWGSWNYPGYFIPWDQLLNNLQQYSQAYNSGVNYIATFRQYGLMSDQDVKIYQLSNALDTPFMDPCDGSEAVMMAEDLIDNYTPIDVPKEKWINRGMKAYNAGFGCH